MSDGGRFYPNYTGGPGTWSATPIPSAVTGMSGSAPSARAYHSAIWTGTGGKMLIWGGQFAVVATNPMYFADGKLYDPATNAWGDSLTTTNAPGQRSGHSAVWTGSEMIIWGGFNGTVSLGDIFRFLPAP